MTDNEHWQWQEPGTAWKGVGVYHVTLTVPSREPLLGTLVMPGDDPSQARVERTALGNAIVEELYVMCRHYPAIRILQFCLMPDHLHAIIYVTKRMEVSIRSVVRGYWQGVKKHGRAYTLSVDAELNSATMNKGSENKGGLNSGSLNNGSLNSGSLNKGSENKGSLNKGSPNSGSPNNGGLSFPFHIFTERPFIRPLSRRGQLQTMFRYVQMNPQRLATKRLKPGYFRVQQDIEIGGRRYDGVGNVALLTERRYDVVHVRSTMVKSAEQGDNQPLRDYMNSRVLMARNGVLMVSPFISPHEKMVMQVLLKERHPIILLTSNGFSDYYKPADGLFDACAAGRLLILSPWLYDGGKRPVSRAECMALNAMAEEICKALLEL